MNKQDWKLNLLIIILIIVFIVCVILIISSLYNSIKEQFKCIDGYYIYIDLNNNKGKAIDCDKNFQPYLTCELKDGTIMYADWYFYLEGETFDYVSAKFVEGEVVQLQVDIKPGTTKEQVLKEFGLHEKEVTYDMSPCQIVVAIVVERTFDDANISRLPREWD